MPPIRSSTGKSLSTFTSILFPIAASVVSTVTSAFAAETSTSRFSPALSFAFCVRVLPTLIGNP